MTQIYHAHLYGTRDSKYDWLQNHDVLSTDWQDLKPHGIKASSLEISLSAFLLMA
jgi:hypothetical protein